MSIKNVFTQELTKCSNLYYSLKQKTLFVEIEQLDETAESYKVTYDFTKLGIKVV